MAKQTIADLSLKISADPTGVTTGIMKAEKAVRGFTSGMASALKGGLSGLSSSVSDALSKPFDLLTGLTKKIPFIGDLLALPFEAVSGLLTEFQKGSQIIKDLGTSAAKAGLGVADFQAFTVAAGDDVAMVTKALGRYNIMLEDAKDINSAAALSFRKLGLDAADLAKMGDKGIYKVFDVLKAAGPGMGVGLAGGIFGKKAAVGMGRLIQFGGEGVKGIKEKIAGAGGTVTEADVANVRAAEEWKRQVSRFWDAVTIQITTSIAPIIAELTETFGPLGLSAKGLGDAIIDTAEFLSGWVLAVAPVVIGFATEIGNATMSVVRFINSLNLQGKASDIGGGKINDLAEQIRKANAEGKFGGGDDMRPKWMQERDNETPANRAMRELSEFFERVRQRKAGAGAELDEKAKAAAAFAAAQAKAAPLVDSLKGPLDAFAKSLEDVNAAAQALTEDQQAMLRGKAFGALDAAFSKATDKSPAALLAGTTAAYSAAIAFTREGQAATDPQARIEAILKEQRAKQDIQIELGRRVAIAMENLGDHLNVAEEM